MLKFIKIIEGDDASEQNNRQRTRVPTVRVLKGQIGERATQKIMKEYYLRNNKRGKK